MSTYSENRREFLKKSAGLAALGMAAPYVFTGATSAAESKADKLVMGAIGVGDRGMQIGRQAASLATMVACADVHSGHARNFANNMEKDFQSKCKIHKDYRALLDDPAIEAVTIATPEHWHVKIAIDALKAGKHVYCEKPLTLTIDEGRLVCEAAKKYGKTFQVGTQQRSEYDLLFLKAVAIAHSGRLGKSLKAICAVGEAGSRSPDKKRPNGPFETSAPPKELDWNFWLGQAPEVDFCSNRIEWNYRWWYEYSGGQLTEFGVHHVDIAFWALAGKDGRVVSAEPVKSEFGMVPREKVRDFLLGKIPPKEMPHSYNVVHSFDVDLKLSTDNEIKVVSNPEELLIWGEKGKIRVNRKRLTGKPVEEIEADPKAQAELDRQVEELYGEKLDVIKQGHMANFLSCIRSGKRPISNVEEHVQSVNACHFANISLLLDRKVQWDAQADQFKGDDEANVLCSRKQRPPFQIEV